MYFYALAKISFKDLFLISKQSHKLSLFVHFWPVNFLKPKFTPLCDPVKLIIFVKVLVTLNRLTGSTLLEWPCF